MKTWDVFISHATEDKKSVANPLVDILVRSGLKVWIDQFEIGIGDSLREKIDEGLSESMFGVVILSKTFLKKGWTKKELNGLFALEEDGVKVILPVWHEISKAEVAEHSPMLADRRAANTQHGIQNIAREIASVIVSDKRPRPGDASLASQLVDLLDNRFSPAGICTFLSTFPNVLGRDAGIECDHVDICPCWDFKPDLTFSENAQSIGDVCLHCYFFCPVDGPFFLNGEPIGALKTKIELIQEERRKHPSIFRFKVIAGRRDRLLDGDRIGFRSLIEQGINIRTYDRLIEACLNADK